MTYHDGICSTAGLNDSLKMGGNWSSGLSRSIKVFLKIQELKVMTGSLYDSLALEVQIEQ